MDKCKSLLLEHTYYLLPLCLDAMVNMKESVASWIVAHDYVVRCKLTSKEVGLPPWAYTHPLFGVTRALFVGYGE